MFRKINASIAIFIFAYAGASQAQISAAVDYPKKALKEGREGKTSVTLAIGVDGRAQDCVVTQSSGSDDLDAETCKMLVTRGRWKPSLDANGTPIESRYSTTMTWKIPQRH